MPWGAIIGAGSALLGMNAADNAASAQQAATDKAVGEQQRQFDTTRSDLAPYRQAGNAALARLQALLGLSSPAPVAPTRDQFTKKTSTPEMTAGSPVVMTTGSQWPPTVTPGSNAGDFDQTGFDAATQKYNQDLTDFNNQKSSPDYGSLLRKFSSSDLNADPVYNSGLQFGLNEGEKAINNRAAAGGGWDSGATLKALSRYANDYGSTKAGESYNRFMTDQGNTYNRLAGVAGTGQNATNTLAGLGSTTATNLGNLYTGGANAAGAAGIAGANAISSGANNYMNYKLLSQLTGGGQRTTYDPATNPM
jgi:hypothetical protein